MSSCFIGNLKYTSMTSLTGTVLDYKLFQIEFSNILVTTDYKKIMNWSYGSYMTLSISHYLINHLNVFIFVFLLWCAIMNRQSVFNGC